MRTTLFRCDKIYNLQKLVVGPLVIYFVIADSGVERIFNSRVIYVLPRKM